MRRWARWWSLCSVRGDTRSRASDSLSGALVLLCDKVLCVKQMNVFDLLFLVTSCATVAALFVSLFLAIRGQAVRSGRILRLWLLGASLYLGALVLVSIVAPRRVLHLNETRCFDDWCIAVASVKWSPQPVPQTRYMSFVAALRLSSRAHRVSQRENDLAVYLTDDRERRYDPLPERSTVPLSVLLQPGSTVEATRVFHVPVDARGIGLVIAHEGGFPIRWFIINEESWFRKPTIVPLT